MSAAEIVGSGRHIGEKFAATPDFDIMRIGQEFRKGNGGSITDTFPLDCTVNPTSHINDEELVANHPRPPVGDGLGVVVTAPGPINSTLVTVYATFIFRNSADADMSMHRRIQPAFALAIKCRRAETKGLRGLAHVTARPRNRGLDRPALDGVERHSGQGLTKYRRCIVAA